MTKRRRNVLIVCAALLLGLAAAAGFVYQAVWQVPDFYRGALAQQPQAARKGSDEFLEKSTALAADARKAGRWQARFTAEQINGWLAVDVPRNHPDLLPPQLKDPRVALSAGALRIGCRYDTGEHSVIVSLALDLFVSGPDVLGVRLRGVRAGVLPIPMARVLEAITRALENSDVPLRWGQADGDPVALITLSGADKGRTLRLENILVADGELIIEGRTEQSSREPRLAAPP